jgi:hypothetical protein
VCSWYIRFKPFYDEFFQIHRDRRGERVNVQKEREEAKGTKVAKYINIFKLRRLSLILLTGEMGSSPFPWIYSQPHSRFEYTVWVRR